MDLFRFWYPVSSNQAVAEISDVLGLGIEQFMAGKKIDMLNAPATYLQNRNEKLAGLNAKIKKDYGKKSKHLHQAMRTHYGWSSLPLKTPEGRRGQPTG
jgi:hypothetical protein